MSEKDETQSPARGFTLHRIYLKDLSFETPGSPDIFSGGEWTPETSMNLSTETQRLGDESFEVVLTVTLSTKVGERTAYLVEVKQAGIFGLRDFPETEMGPLLGSYCPGILFPYAREVVSDVIAKGSFPQLLLTPVNFDALYEQHLKGLAEKSASAEGHKAG
ncbi:MAG: protein-export chaperone SecB [Chromatiales bacterium]|jgi:preprotein translocase subunit SecB